MVKQKLYKISDVAKITAFSKAYIYKMLYAGTLSEKAGEVIRQNPSGHRYVWRITAKGFKKLGGQEAPEIYSDDFIDALADRIVEKLKQKTLV